MKILLRFKSLLLEMSREAALNAVGHFRHGNRGDTAWKCHTIDWKQESGVSSRIVKCFSSVAPCFCPTVLPEAGAF
jgi:hypothetical protein